MLNLHLELCRFLGLRNFWTKPNPRPIQFTLIILVFFFWPGRFPTGSKQFVFFCFWGEKCWPRGKKMENTPNPFFFWNICFSFFFSYEEKKRLDELCKLLVSGRNNLMIKRNFAVYLSLIFSELLQSNQF